MMIALGTVCFAVCPTCFLIQTFESLISFLLFIQARWYLKAAEGGYLRAMYNVSLCYKFGEGLVRSYSQARKWMKQAADCGHSKAQYEYGVALFSVSIMCCIH